jgi:hypothetical protein
MVIYDILKGKLEKLSQKYCWREVFAYSTRFSEKSIGKENDPHFHQPNIEDTSQIIPSSLDSEEAEASFIGCDKPLDSTPVTITKRRPKPTAFHNKVLSSPPIFNIPPYEYLDEESDEEIERIPAPKSSYRSKRIIDESSSDDESTSKSPSPRNTIDQNNDIESLMKSLIMADDDASESSSINDDQDEEEEDDVGEEESLNDFIADDDDDNDDDIDLDCDQIEEQDELDSHEEDDIAVDKSKAPAASASATLTNKSRDSLATKLFHSYNRSVFKNQLPSDLKITWSKRLLTTAG